MRFPRNALAAWRLVELVHNEEGPYRIVARFREWAGPTTWLEEVGTGRRYPFIDPQPTGVEIVEQVGIKGEISKAVECKWCLSIWAGMAIALLDRAAPLVVDALALSASAVLVGEARERVSSGHGESNPSDMAEPR